MYLVSVIVPNYNNGLWIRDCLNSILEQTYKNIEIVVIDDHSTDNSREVIKDYQKQYANIFQAVFLEKNAGVAEARHIGIVKSRGKYITTLDADDYYADKKKLEKEIELVLEYKQKYNQDIIAFSNILIEYPGGSKKPQGNEKNIVQGNILEKILTRNCMIPRDFTFLKPIYFDIGGYDFCLKTHEDWDLKIRLAKKFEFYFTGINGTIYRQHNNGLSSTPYDFRTKNLFKVFNKNISLIKEIEFRRNIIKDFNYFMEKRDKNFYKRVKK
jgi:glycosyltransferase involved in cell wall biosynthesis